MLHTMIPLDKNNPEVRLETYVIDGFTNTPGLKRPAILICPGGGYLKASDKESEPVALRFAAMGYHAFVLRYHVYLTEEEDKNASVVAADSFEKRESSVYPAAIRDIAHALTVIAAHANEWAVDLEKIALCGFSAGGHNVLTYATQWNQPVIRELYSGDFLKPAAVIAGYPLTDYVFHEKFLEKANVQVQQFFSLSNLALFGTTKPTLTQLEAVSPARQITETMSPVFVFATALDPLVNIGHTTRLATALAEYQIPFEMHIYEEGKHGLALGMQATARDTSELDANFETWIQHVEAWLLKRFALPIRL